MGDTLYVVGERMNAVTCAYAPISPTGDPLFPFTNLTGGIPGRPGSFLTLAGVNIDGDLNEVPNGGMEDTFASSLPTAAWTKIATGTITRDTGTKYAGSASLKLVGVANGDGVYYDLRVRPGEAWNFSGAAYSGAGGTVAAVRVRNMATGNWLSNSGTWGSATANLCSSTSAAWGARIVGTTIESWALCGNVPLVTIRIYALAASAPIDNLFFDEICAWRTPTFASIHGHNIPTRCAPVELCLGTAASPTTVAGTFGYCEGSMFTASIAVVPNARYYRLRVTNAPLEEPIWIDKLVLGQHQTMSKRQKWEQAASLAQAQDRSDNDQGPQQSYLRSRTQRAQWAMTFLDVGEDEFSERRRIMLDSGNGAFPSVFVPSATTDVALAGRQVFLVRLEEKEFKHQRQAAVVALRGSSITLNEFPIFAGMMG